MGIDTLAFLIRTAVLLVFIGYLVKTLIKEWKTK